jgi:CheY-like chemotaxis protein
MEQAMHIIDELEWSPTEHKVGVQFMEKGKILIVYGSRETREALELMFQQAGFSVFAAENAAVAWGALDSFEPDLILTDLMMPLVAGEEFIRVLKQQPRLVATPIVVLSEYSDIFGENAKAAGATVVLRKPRDMSAVIETVSKLLGKSEEWGR